MKNFFGLIFFLVFALNSIKLQAEPVEVKVILDRQYGPVALKAIEEAKESINFAIFEIRYYPEYLQSPSNLFF